MQINFYLRFITSFSCCLICQKHATGFLTLFCPTIQNRAKLYNLWIKKGRTTPTSRQPGHLLFKIRGFPPPDHSGFGLFWIINAIIPALCFLVYFEDNAVLSIKIRKLSGSIAAPNILQILCLYLLFLSLARKTGTYINLGKSIISNWDIL